MRWGRSLLAAPRARRAVRHLALGAPQEVHDQHDEQDDDECSHTDVHEDSYVGWTAAVRRLGLCVPISRGTHANIFGQSGKTSLTFLLDAAFGHFLFVFGNALVDLG